jgi:hypothetical protein
MQPTQQFYFCIVVFQLFYPTPLSSSRIFKTIIKLPNTCPFPRSFRGLVSWEPYISVKCEPGDYVEFWSQFVSLDVTWSAKYIRTLHSHGGQRKGTNQCRMIRLYIYICMYGKNTPMECLIIEFWCTVTLRDTLSSLGVSLCSSPLSSVFQIIFPLKGE